MKKIEYFLDCSSPWTYLSFRGIMQLKEDKNFSIIWKPILVGGIFNSINPSVYESRKNPIKEEIADPSGVSRWVSSLWRSQILLLGHPGLPFREGGWVHTCSLWGCKIQIPHETTPHQSFCNICIMNIHDFYTRNSLVTSISSPDNTFAMFLMFFCIRI